MSVYALKYLQDISDAISDLEICLVELKSKKEHYKNIVRCQK